MQNCRAFRENRFRTEKEPGTRFGTGTDPRNPLFLVLRARRTCITQHRGVSKAPSITMHVGATPSGPEPSGKNSNIFTINWRCPYLSCAGAQISHFSSLRRNHLVPRFAGFGKGVKGEPRETAGLQKGFLLGPPTGLRLKCGDL
jgi:hypothetical protein